MIQDPLVANQETLEKATEGYHAIQREFLDGPVTDRLAVLDIDPEAGVLRPGVKVFKKPGQKMWKYIDASGRDLYTYKGDELQSPDFLQVSTFATVLKTLELFEKEHNSRSGDIRIEKFGLLGRQLKWAFDSPQLFIVPRAGNMPNAFYNRDTYSLEFFFFPSINHGRMIYSGLSREIVGHEAGHAIIDAIAPDLMDAFTPDSLALHEGLADMVALFLSFSSTNLVKFVLNHSDGSIRKQSHFTNLAEEFAQGRSGKKNLRDFLSKKNFIYGTPEYVSGKDPHDMSEVLSGALYTTLIEYHDALKVEEVNTGKYDDYDNPTFSASGYALVLAYRRFKRILFRGLDYLPPGEITFADYGRAVMAADLVEAKNDDTIRNLLAIEFEKRGLTGSKELLLVDVARHKKLDVDLQKLANTPSYAMEFANKHRELLQIPKNKIFEVQSCHLTDYYTGNKKGRDVCIFKVCWHQLESNGSKDPRLAPKRELKVGTSLVIDLATQEIIACLCNARPTKKSTPFEYKLRQKENNAAKKRRTAFIHQMFKDGMLKMDDERQGLEERELQNVVAGHTKDGILRIKGSGKSLHICK